jgi:hypothetical protein
MPCGQGSFSQRTRRLQGSRRYVAFQNSSGPDRSGVRGRTCPLRIYREEVTAVLIVLADMNVKLGQIVKLLEGGDDEDEAEGDDA